MYSRFPSPICNVSTLCLRVLSVVVVVVVLVVVVVVGQKFRQTFFTVSCRYRCCLKHREPQIRQNISTT